MFYYLRGNGRGKGFFTWLTGKADSGLFPQPLRKVPNRQVTNRFHIGNKTGEANQKPHSTT